jgi:hypothetical protein
MGGASRHRSVRFAGSGTNWRSRFNLKGDLAEASEDPEFVQRSPDEPRILVE